MLIVGSCTDDEPIRTPTLRRRRPKWLVARRLERDEEVGKDDFDHLAGSPVRK